MSNLIACQPGWVAVFAQTDGDGYYTEPVACWLYVEAPHGADVVRPMCALGGDICAASLADNYVGVIGPVSDVSTHARTLLKAWRDSQTKPAA